MHLTKTYDPYVAYKWKVHNGKMKIISFVVKFRSEPAPTVTFNV